MANSVPTPHTEVAFNALEHVRKPEFPIHTVCSWFGVALPYHMRATASTSPCSYSVSNGHYVSPARRHSRRSLDLVHRRERAPKESPDALYQFGYGGSVIN